MRDFAKFMSTLTSLGGPQRVTHFMVEIVTPSALNNITNAETLSMLCEATNLPGVAITTDDRNFTYGLGISHKIPFGVVFTEQNLTFIADNRGAVHDALTTWMNSVIDYNNEVDPNTYLVSYKSVYSTKVAIRAYDETMSQIMEFMLYDCYPTAIFDMPASWSGTDQFHRINVRLTFNRWTVKYSKIPAKAKSFLSGINQGISALLAGRQVEIFKVPEPLTIEQPPVAQYISQYQNLLPTLSGLDIR